jgi:hypothetical protein
MANLPWGVLYHVGAPVLAALAHPFYLNQPAARCSVGRDARAVFRRATPVSIRVGHEQCGPFPADRVPLEN